MPTLLPLLINSNTLFQASGNLGPSILSALDSNPRFAGDIEVLSRASSKTTFPPHIKIHRVSDSYPFDELVAAFKDQDAIVNMAPISEVATHKTIIDAAIKAGVKRIVLSEFGTNVPELQTTEPLADVYKGKVEIRKYMESKEGQGLTWTGLVVGAFFDWYAPTPPPLSHHLTPITIAQGPRRRLPRLRPQIPHRHHLRLRHRPHQLHPPRHHGPRHHRHPR